MLILTFLFYLNDIVNSFPLVKIFFSTVVSVFSTSLLLRLDWFSNEHKSFFNRFNGSRNG